MIPRLRVRAGLLAALALLHPARAAVAQWVPDGTIVCSAPGDQLGVHVAPDGAGGLYLVWEDRRDAPSQVYLQRFTAAGAPAPGWPTNGMPVSPSATAQGSPGVVPDGAGGALVMWTTDAGGGATNQMLERITPAGTVAPAWPAAGVVAGTYSSSSSPTYSTAAEPRGGAADLAGGAYVFWATSTNLCPDICYGSAAGLVKRIDGTGALAAGWGASGITLAGSSYATPGAVVVGGIPDGSGGLFATGWGYGSSLTLRHLGAGGATLWFQAIGSDFYFDPATLAPDGAGGVFAFWDDAGYAPSRAIHAQHYTSGGALAPGWPAGGITLGALPPTTDALLVRAIPDGAGGAIVCWWTGPGNLTALRITPGGAAAPGWGSGGVPVCAVSSATQGVDMVPDGTHGAFLAWADTRHAGGYGLYALRLDGSGSVSPGWTANGTPICMAPGTRGGPVMAATEAGAAILGWSDVRGGATSDVYALRLPPDQAVPVEVTLVSAITGPGLARLEWRLGPTDDAGITVQWRTEAGAWTDLATVSRGPSGSVAYEDRAAIAGERLGYRLALDGAGGRSCAGEVWLTIPAEAALALRGWAPNPATGAPAISFTLTGDGPATLEVLDATGRRVSSREVGGLGPGAHSLDPGAGSEIRPGIYFVRLSQGGRTVRWRGAIVR